MDVDHRERLRSRDHQRKRLRAVVVEHEFGDLVGHRDEQVVALLRREVAVAHELIEHDLDVDLVVAAVDTGRVVDGVGVDQPTVDGVLDACQLGQPEVPALTDDPTPQVDGVDAQRVVRTIAGGIVWLGTRLHVRADAAVPQQVDRSAQDRRDEVVGSQRDHVGVDVERNRGPRR